MTNTPGPEGSWPLDPQVPPYEQPSATPQYPISVPQYGPPPQPTPYPAQPPSFFAAPGQPYPGQPYPGQPYAGQPPYAGRPPVFMPGAESPPDNLQTDRVPAKYGVMAIAAVVLIAAIGVGVGVWSMSWAPKTTAASVWTAQPTPTMTTAATPTKSSTPFPSTAANCSGTSAGTPDWEASVPSGWFCSYQAGNEITIANSSQDAILVRATNEPNVSAACTSDLNPDATVTVLADTTWGGKVSKTSDLVYRGLSGQARCVKALGYTYVMVGMVITGTGDKIVGGENALTQSWVWKA